MRFRQFTIAKSGIYGISKTPEWIFIGDTDNIQASLGHYSQRGGLGIPEKIPAEFVFELCDAADRRAGQDRLVLEYEPACNRRLSGDDMRGTI